MGREQLGSTGTEESPPDYRHLREDRRVFRRTEGPPWLGQPAA